MNNGVLSKLLPVEKPLVAPYLKKFDDVIETGLVKLNWRSTGVEEFITESMEQVEIVHEVLKTMKDNFTAVENLMVKWDKPLIERKVKPVEKDELERMVKAIRTSAYAEIKESGKSIHNLLKESNKVLRVSNASANWRSYVDFVNNVVIDGLSTSITTSLEFLLNQIDPVKILEEEKLPLLELKLTLEADGVKFTPDIGYADGKGVRDMIDNIVGSFLQISTLFKRLDADGTYMREMHTDIDVNNYMAMLTETLSENEDKCNELKDTFESYSYLWTTDLNAHFAEFCDDAKIVTDNGTELLDLTKFESAIKKYEEIQKVVVKFKSPSDVGWLRINITPIKQALSLYATKWIDMFTSHLLTTSIKTMTELHEFILKTQEGLDKEVPEENTENEALMAVMGDIRDVRKAEPTVPELFGPQREIVNILKRHHVDVLGSAVAGKNLQDFLEEVPMTWEMIVKKTYSKKEDILPMQLASQDRIKADLEIFYTSLREFRGEFRKVSGRSERAFDEDETFFKSHSTNNQTIPNLFKMRLASLGASLGAGCSLQIHRHRR